MNTYIWTCTHCVCCGKYENYGMQKTVSKINDLFFLYIIFISLYSHILSVDLHRYAYYLIMLWSYYLQLQMFLCLVFNRKISLLHWIFIELFIYLFTYLDRGVGWRVRWMPVSSWVVFFQKYLLENVQWNGSYEFS